VNWQLTTDLRGIDNVPCSGVQDITGATVANCGTGPEGARDAAHIVKCVNAHDELVAALESCRDRIGVLGANPDDIQAWESARVALAKVLLRDCRGHSAINRPACAPRITAMDVLKAPIERAR
jgi:hypothetical protein